VSDLQLFQSDAIEMLKRLPESSVSLLITDPTWNTGQVRKAGAGSYDDNMDHDEYCSYMNDFMVEARRVLSATGTLAIWTDYRYAPYIAVLGDGVFGRERRVGEIIVEQLLGRCSNKVWPTKHGNITLFAKTPKQKFYYDRLPEVDRRSAGKKVVAADGSVTDYSGSKKVASVIQGTLSNSATERVGYPDQKPAFVYGYLINCFTDVGDLVVDPFAGSGTCGAACAGTGRKCLLSDRSSESIEVIRRRLGIEVST
jgi:site-specific DNA-methyltransferase (adenine-specific)